MTRSTNANDTLGAMLADLARRRGSAPAFIGEGETISYAAFDGASRRLAQGLWELGIRAGDGVALWLPNGPEWLALHFACARLGAVTVVVNTKFRVTEVEDLLARSKARLLVCWPHFKGIDFLGILREIDPLAVTALKAVIVCGDEARPPERTLERATLPYRALTVKRPFDDDHAAPEAGAILFTTSGTTSASKLVLQTHGAITRHARAVAERFGYTSPDCRLLQLLPFCGVFGYSAAIAAIAAGRALVIRPSFRAEEAAKLIAQHGITHMIGSDEMFRRILSFGEGERPFPRWRFAGFAAFNPSITDLVSAGEERGICFYGLYGSSELLALFAAQAPDARPEARAQAGGFTVSPEARVRAREPASGRILPPGETGELELKGPSLMAGYLGDPDTTRDALTEDGYLRTGDLGYVRSDGGFVFLARAGELLRLGGFLVNPQEIEDFIQSHESIEGCQVVSGAEGTRPVAFVTLAKASTLDEPALRAHCLKGIAKYKVPERFVALDAFPTTQSANGIKIQRHRLREQAEAILESGKARVGRTRPARDQSAPLPRS